MFRTLNFIFFRFDLNVRLWFNLFVTQMQSKLIKKSLGVIELLIYEVGLFWFREVREGRAVEGCENIFDRGYKKEV